MSERVGISFREGGKEYSFNPDGLVLNAGEKVIVETERGLSCGTVTSPNRTYNDEKVLAKVKRLCTEEDLNQLERNLSTEADAMRIGKTLIEQFRLKMEPITCECLFDRSKLLFNFRSEERVDFREFVKALGGALHMRIEMRQYGVRDYARQIGGLGICGREICCRCFLHDFNNVSIKMAKNQGLSLKADGLSGLCGRYMCCLRYEEEYYESVNEINPRAGETIKTPDGDAVVTYSNVLLGKVKVRMCDERAVPAIREYDSSSIERSKKAIAATAMNLDKAKPVKTVSNAPKAPAHGKPNAVSVKAGAVPQREELGVFGAPVAEPVQSATVVPTPTHAERPVPAPTEVKKEEAPAPVPANEAEDTDFLGVFGG